MLGEARHVADLYVGTTARVATLLAGAKWDRAVPACPGWSIRDVVAHMVAVAQDWADGSLSGPPTDADTAEHIRRYPGLTDSALLSEWSDAADRLHDLASSEGHEPPTGDVACHEHDIRGALGIGGARDSESVRWTSHRLLTMLAAPVPLRVVVEDADYRSGPACGPETILRTTRFEAVRWRTGRRSVAQLAAMDWSADPAPLLEHLCLFGPADTDVIE